MSLFIPSIQRGARLLAACGLALVGNTAVGQEATVGPFGDPARLVIHGVQTVPTQEVVKALFDDLDVAYASFPDAPLAEFERLVVEKTIIGFRHLGFAAPRVTTAKPRGHLVLSVDEGPRWTAGGIRVVGARAIDARKLAEDLSHDDPVDSILSPRKAPRWDRGKPAPLDEPTRLQFGPRVDELLAQQGYANAKSRVDIVGEAKRGAATLLVTINQEAAPARAGEIEIVNNTIHSREQILDYLNVPSDAVMSAELSTKIKKDLLASGRFTWCGFYQPAKDSKPRLWVDEDADAPRLDEPLSSEQTALLKLAAWMDAFDQQNENLVFRTRWDDTWLEITLTPRQGFVARLGARGTSSFSDAFDLAAVYSEDQIALYSSKTARKLDINFAGETYIPGATFNVLSDLDKGEGKHGINVVVMNRSRKYADTRSRPRASIRPVLAASTALSIVTKRHARCEWNGPILTARWGGNLLRVDSRNGRLVELRFSDRKKRLFLRASQAGETKSVTRTTAELFEQRRGEIAVNTASFENILDRQRLISGAAQFVCRALAEDGLASDDASQRLCALIGRLSRQGVFQPIDDYLVSAMRPQPEFRIPVASPPRETALWLNFNREDGFQLEINRVTLGVASDLFVPGSHPWWVWREAAFLTNGKTEHAQARLARLFPPEQSGPVTTLALAEALCLADMNNQAGNWARQRMEYATLDGFRGDYADFLHPSCRASNYVLQVADALRALDPADAEALFDHFRSMGWLTKSQKRIALQFLGELRTDPNRPLAAALSAALDDFWRSTVQQKIEQRLKAINSLRPIRHQLRARRRRFLLR